MDTLTLLRRSIDDAYARWAPTAERAVTRAGERYVSFDLVALLAPPLRSLGVHVAYLPETEEEIFCTPTGRQITRERLAALLAEALAGHHDEALLAGVRSPHTLRLLLGVLPTYEGPVTRTRRPAAPTPPREPDEDEAGYVEFFLRDRLTAPTKTSAAYAAYVAMTEEDDVEALGKVRFFDTALRSGLVVRRRRRDGHYLIPTEKIYEM